MLLLAVLPLRAQDETPSANDNTRAAHYLRAAHKGDLNAQYNLGVCFEKGYEGFEYDMSQAVYWYTKAAEGGHVNARYNLALCYEEGRGTEIDWKQAAHWYELAANGGHKKAMYNLALLYQAVGSSIHDCQKAIEWYTRAADTGVVMAQYNLARCYMTGDCTERDTAKAIVWYTAAAQQGHVNSLVAMGTMFISDKDSTNDADAVLYLEQAADKGDVLAQSTLGACYYNGYGVKRDYAKAFSYYKKAATRGNVGSPKQPRRVLSEWSRR